MEGVQETQPQKKNWCKDPKHIYFIVFMLYTFATILYLVILMITRLFDQFFPKAYSTQFGIMAVMTTIGVCVCFLFSFFIHTSCGTRCTFVLKIIALIGIIIAIAFYLVLAFLSSKDQIVQTITLQLANYTIKNPTAPETKWFVEKTKNAAGIESYVKSRSVSMSKEVFGVVTPFCVLALFLYIYTIFCGPNGPCGTKYLFVKQENVTTSTPLNP